MINLANHTKATLTAALGDLEVTVPRKANLEVLRALYLANYIPEGSSSLISEMECPHCGVTLDNGVLHRSDTIANSDSVTYHMQGMVNAYECMGCGGQFGDVVDAYVAPAAPAPATGTGLKIEKDRPEQNGIRRPSAGGKCRAVWDAMDLIANGNPAAVTAAQVKGAAEQHGWNPNNASIEFYQWRKFNGVTGRAPKAVAPAAPAAPPATPSLAEQTFYAMGGEPGTYVAPEVSDLDNTPPSE
jgi:hypothetical protein